MKRRYVYLVERVNGSNYIPMMATVSKRRAMEFGKGLHQYESCVRHAVPHIIVTRLVDGTTETTTIMWDSEALDLVG